MSENYEHTSAADIQTVNRFEVSGKVIRKGTNDKMFFCILATMNQATKKVNYPRFLSFENIAEFDAACRIGARVKLEGYLMTSKKHPEGAAYLTKVTPLLSIIDSEFANEEYTEDSNKVLLKGNLLHDPYRPNDTVTLLTLELKDGKDHKAFVKVVCFGEIGKKMAETKKKGDIVQCIGYIQSVPSAKKKALAITEQSIVARKVK